MTIRLQALLLLIVFLAICKNINAQNTYQQADLSEVIQSIEQSSKWIFNYDPSALAAYQFTGQLKKVSIKSQLQQLFYKTPYTFEISNNAILIFLETPKTYRICGTVRDKISQTPLPLANIFLDDLKQGTQSDDAGAFEVEITAHKHQIVTISYVGYQSESFMIQEMNSVDCSDFLLMIDETLFGEEIIVKDYILQEITEGERYNSVRFDYQKLLNKYTIIEQDVLKTVQLIPGVTSIDESATNLQIRGGTPDQNLVIWEDVTLYDPGHLFGMISAVNPYVIEEVQVFKGVFDPRYDNRVGGIVDLSLSDSIPSKFHGGLGSTLTEAHAYAKIPLVKNKLSLVLSGRNTINGLYNSPTITNYSNKVFQETKIDDEQAEVAEGEREAQQQLDFYDLNGKVIFKPINNWTLKGSWFRTHNAFKYESVFLEDDLTSIDDVLFNSKALNLSSKIGLNPNWSVVLSYAQSDYSNDYIFTLIEATGDTNFYANLVTNSIFDQTFSAATQYQWSPHLNFSLGYDYNVKSVNYNIDIAATYEENFKEANSTEGQFHNTYLGFNFQKKQLSINGGLRNTFYREVQKNWLSPRLNIQYSLTKNLKLKLSGGIFQQYISQLKEFGENSLGLNNQVWIINRNEEEEEVVQSANKIAAGLVFHQNGWLIDLEGYYNKTNGLSTFNPSFNSSAGSDLDFSVGNSTAKGIDLLIKKRWRNYHVWLNYSLSEVAYFFPEIVENAFPASNDQRHRISLVNNWTYKNWNFSLNYQFKTGLPFTQALDIDTETEYNEEEEIEETYAFVEYDKPNAQKLNNYSRLDIGLSYRPTFKNSNLKAELAFSIINLMNTSNDFSRDYYIEEDENEDEEIQLELFDINRRLLKRTPLLSIRFFW